MYVVRTYSFNVTQHPEAKSFNKCNKTVGLKTGLVQIKNPHYVQAYRKGKKLLSMYGNCPKSERSDFGAFIFGSVAV